MGLIVPHNLTMDTEQRKGTCRWGRDSGTHQEQCGAVFQNSNPRLLLSTDDPASASSLRAALEDVGIQIAFTPPDKAVRAATDLKPNLVLMDSSRKGIEVLDIIRTYHSCASCWSASLIVLCESIEQSERIRTLGCGAIATLLKPVEIHEVLSAVAVRLRLQTAFTALSNAHSNTLKMLAQAQQACMARPQSLPGAKFGVALRQVHLAGGDFYDVMDHGDEKVDYIVADASGHDLAATYWTMALKTLLVEYSDLQFSPLDAFYLINRALLRILPEEVFFTAIHVRVNRAAGEAHILTAGHPPAIYTPGSGAPPLLIQQQSDVLGAFGDAKFGRTDLQMVPGDRLYLYSDGLTEGSGAGIVGYQRLLQTLDQKRALPLDEVVDEVLACQFQGCTPADDAVLMGIEI